MSRRLRNILPIVALIGALITFGALMLTVDQRQTMLTDTGETRVAVESTIEGLQALYPPSVEDPGFLAEVKQSAQAPFVATVWVISPDGRIVYSSGSTASKGLIEQRATDEMRRVLASLPDGTLDAEQRLEMLSASAIQAEGEHNDVYRHLLRQVFASDGTMVGMIGVAYDVNPQVGMPDLGWMIGLLAFLFGLALYWLALPLWVFLDARERGERAWVWASFVFIGNLVALIAYILARSPQQKDISH